jgi:uncharacterized protein (TIGR02118 family)
VYGAKLIARRMRRMLCDRNAVNRNWFERENEQPMVKLIALYRKPADPAAFDKHYFEIHAPLAARMPGLRRMEVAKCYGSPAGEPKFHLQAEMYFDSREALMAALGSPEGKAAGKDVMSFAGDLITMVFAEVQS